MRRQQFQPQGVVDILKVEYIPAYTIHFWFSDGAEQEIDFEPFLRAARHPDIRKYLDPALFRQFTLVHGRLDWNDYDLCFSIEDLYEGTICHQMSRPQPVRRLLRKRRTANAVPEFSHS